jgi:hypothetical protein
MKETQFLKLYGRSDCLSRGYDGSGVGSGQGVTQLTNQTPGTADRNAQGRKAGT